jgi:hypothetical protein
MGTHRGAIYDASVKALFRMDEAAQANALVDVTGNYNAALVGTGFTPGSGQISGKRGCVTASSQWHKKGPLTFAADPITLMFESGIWTVEFWLARTGVGSTQYECPFVCSDLAIAFARQCSFFVNNANNDFFFSYMKGFNSYDGFSMGAMAADSVMHHWALSVNTSGTATFKVYKDGSLVGTNSGMAPISTGTGSADRFMAWGGESANGGTTPYHYNSFDYDDWRFSGVVRSAADILTTYKRGAGTAIYTTQVSPASGQSGQTLDIYGENFTATMTGTLGGNALAITFISSTHVQVTAPTHANGAADLTFTETDGSYDTLASAYTYVTYSAHELASEILG